MPITQSRVIAIIDAGIDMKEKLIALREAVQCAQGAENTTDALRVLWDAWFACCPDTHSIEVLACEATHFKKAAHKNNRDAARQRARRGTATPDDSAYTLSIHPTPARAAGPRAVAFNNAKRALLDAEIDRIAAAPLATADQFTPSGALIDEDDEQLDIS